MTPVVLLHLFLGTYAGGNTDSFYKRFTSPRQSNLILGNSRSAQGILPHYMKSFNGEPFYNYSFTIFDSPFGDSYLSSVKNKLKLRRILNEMTEAARNQAYYHIWWHPHNFGNNPKECLHELEQIISHFHKLHKAYGFQSMHMQDISELLLSSAKTTVNA